MTERKPLYKNSGYTRQIIWIDQQEYRPFQIQYYDRKNSLLKTLVFSDYKQYKDKFWRAQPNHPFSLAASCIGDACIHSNVAYLGMIGSQRKVHVDQRQAY